MSAHGWRRCRQVARTGSVADALRVIGPHRTGWGRHLIVPAGPDRPPAVADPLLAAEGLAVVRRAAGPHPPGAAEVAAAREVTLATAWLRLGLSERLLDDCLGYLHGRTTGGEPLIGQQLVRGELAEIRMDHLEVAAVLDDAPPSDAQLLDAHRRITGADRSLLRLLGASGFVADGPGRIAYVSELLADAYAGGDRDV
ncbi:Acyl-CoA dehydrogenase, C-terminal domain [Micromonospora coxensis]|uniref:Acyl-CoA dehydrogenase, C-terminal domain n=1 Tax=Micromonospora coxensis TaxID=356852 RepID=A0A1C5K0H1_9ACTN|nr:acyl-CoA dehydrogenase family protein [Micromonospora coxensis]SCG76324.1 Acyl-CoA dehydrogenase, C-terminal domain [Micromonospora coxensis]